ncbi:MAG: PQQ-binding-like beta-propeller repeat protein [Acidobacteriia bacterium]|nr:PQQ-binding-like beta-propeller repeat protein [Terriglobia bacterium]
MYRGRLGAGSPYYSSPVASGGHVYFASSEGVVTVVRDGPELDVVARNELGEVIYATPALATDHIYIRTAGHLYSFRR